MRSSRVSCTRSFRLVVLAELVATLGAVIEYSRAFVCTPKLESVEVHFVVAAVWTFLLDSSLLCCRGLRGNILHELTSLL